MSLPYATATTGKKAIDEIQKILRAFDCQKFATGEDFESGEVFIQFVHRDRTIHLTASAKGYASAWLRENPWSQRRKGTKAGHESKALEIGSVAVYSVLRDWVKGQITAVEIGVMSFEAAFLSHIMLPNGKRVIEQATEMNLLPAPSPEH